MRKLLLIVPMLLLALVPLACKGPTAIDPNFPPILGSSPTFTATSTSTPTPACGLVTVTLPVIATYPVIPIATLRPFITPTPVGTFGGWSTPVPTPTVGPVATHVPFIGVVVQSLPQWQGYFGTTPAPVDFSSQMVILYVSNSCCDGSETVTGACLTSTELDLTVTEHGSIPCNSICSIWSGIVVPATNLPIYITELTYYPGF